jgi:outer membrane protein LpxR
VLFLLASVFLTAQGASVDLRSRSVVRFDFDNDVFLRKDHSFTAGWSLQVHSRMNDVWGSGYVKWIGRVPGLADGGRGGPITRWAVGISQVIITPKDVGNAAPQPNDAPWAGMLGASVSWSAYDNRRMAALQVYAGCLGPCSAAEPVQKFVHGDLGFGPSPKGWDNQLVNRASRPLCHSCRLPPGATAVRRARHPVSLPRPLGRRRVERLDQSLVRVSLLSWWRLSARSPAADCLHPACRDSVRH